MGGKRKGVVGLMWEVRGRVWWGLKWGGKRKDVVGPHVGR